MRICSGKADVSMSGSSSVYSLQTGDLLGASSVFHTGDRVYIGILLFVCRLAGP